MTIILKHKTNVDLIEILRLQLSGKLCCALAIYTELLFNLTSHQTSELSIQSMVD
jgi:hypothetical protein